MTIDIAIEETPKHIERIFNVLFMTVDKQVVARGSWRRVKLRD